MDKKGVAMLVMGAMGLAAALGAEQPPAPAAHAIRLMVMKEVTGDTARAGEPVKLMLVDSVTVGGVAAPAGTRAVGEVVSAAPSGVAMRKGAITIRVTRLLLPGGDVPLSGELSAPARGGRNDDAWKVLFAPMYAPFARGHAARFKAGEVFTLPVAADAAAQAPGH